MTSMWSETKPIGTITTAFARPGGERLEVVVDVGLEPRHVRGAGAGAVDELVPGTGPGLLPDPVDDLGHHAAVLLDVGVALGTGRPRHLGRDRVGDEDQLDAVTVGVVELGQRGQGGVDHRLDEPGVVEVLAEPVEPGCPGTSATRVGEVLPVLAARRSTRSTPRWAAPRPGSPRRPPSAAACRPGRGPSSGCPSRPAGRSRPPPGPRRSAASSARFWSLIGERPPKRK